MVANIPEIPYPEIFFGIVAPIGGDVKACVKDLSRALNALKYEVIEIKVTDVFAPIAKNIIPEVPLSSAPVFERYDSYINYGNQIRQKISDNSFLAALTIGRITYQRNKRAKPDGEGLYSQKAYILHQFKRKEEIDLFRSVYGRLFFQVSVYSRRGSRVDYLARQFAHGKHSSNINDFKTDAEKIVQRDENEQAVGHGQKVSKIFHDADLIINLDLSKPSRSWQIDRFCDLLFGRNNISPNKIEYGMFIAKAAALRTLDLSRQVGAAIFSQQGEIISIGSNEVPKAGGGTYWSDEEIDDREYVREQDSNEVRKIEILLGLFDAMGVNPDDHIGKSSVKDSQFMDALEYGRIIHAEMCAITDAARLGRSLKSGTLFSTAFPCHMCAKHIVSAGIETVIFLEPYPKSLAMDLHTDSISIEGADRGKYQYYPCVRFEHFYGITPRRYRELFERGKRKDDETGQYKDWIKADPRPNLDVKTPFYVEVEEIIVGEYIKSRIEAGLFGDDVFSV
ncbi:anti-phage dCTP deaminase [Methylobacterium sp. AMS5]|uniref:anti-phage dCTP deaminase n=1 Tax=Methylobacterium sp. AMS5 TaxID=925818 RepID=UPI00074F94C7|nr:anti-phage dCTP deaminase [Methylobacterium sp. AMS5]AMB48076.1 CMP/dCMP deaminase [Methylobacterium sp. AMS5]